MHVMDMVVKRFLFLGVNNDFQYQLSFKYFI